MFTVTLQKLFAQTKSIDDLLEQLNDIQSSGVKQLDGPYHSLIDVEFIISTINKMRYDHSKEDIYKTIVFIETGH